jgi:hypothetical protein
MGDVALVVKFHLKDVVLVVQQSGKMWCWWYNNRERCGVGGAAIWKMR